MKSVTKRLGLGISYLESSKPSRTAGFNDCVNLESLGRKSGYSGFDEDSGLNAPIVVNTSRLSSLWLTLSAPSMCYPWKPERSTGFPQNGGRANQS